MVIKKVIRLSAGLAGGTVTAFGGTADFLIRLIIWPIWLVYC